jgi:hypothetical protein
MEELKNSPLYELVDTERAGLEELRFDARIKIIAKRMKKEGVDAEIIMKATGLKKSEIKKL